MLSRNIVQAISNNLNCQQTTKILHKQCCFVHTTTTLNNEEKLQEVEFTPLELYPQDRRDAGRRRFTPAQHKEPIEPRSKSMKTDQNWSDVWPAARTFHPGTVPFPVRMGFPASKQPTPDKWTNTELMKIPNFLHLAPPAVERHCAAIRKFCTPWPEGLSYSSTVTKDNPISADSVPLNRRPKSLKQIAKHDPSPDTAANDPGYFPMLTTRTSYLFSGPSLRDARARVATVKVRLDDLRLDGRSYDKLLRLVGDRYDRDTNTLTIMADRCPLYQQNLQYCHYLLTVITSEAQSNEQWEHEKQRTDNSLFVYEGSNCQSAVRALQAKQAEHGSVNEGAEEKLAQALHCVLNEGETDDSLTAYSERVLELLGLGERCHDAVSTHNPVLALDADTSLPPITAIPYSEKNNIVWNHHSRFKSNYEHKFMYFLE